MKQIAITFAILSVIRAASVGYNSDLEEAEIQDWSVEEDNDENSLYDDLMGAGGDGEEDFITVDEFRHSKPSHYNQPSEAFRELAGDTSNFTDPPLPPRLNSSISSSRGNSSSAYVPVPPVAPTKTLPLSIVASALIISGLFSVFLGQKHIRWILAFFGAIAFGMSAYLIISLKVKPTGPHAQLIYILSPAISALVGGALFSFLQEIASYVLAGFLGFLAGCFLLELSAFSSLELAFRLLIIAGLAIITLIASGFAKKEFLLVSTSFFGSFIVFTGIDYYFFCGFMNVLDITLKQHYLTTVTYVYIGGFLLLAILGIAVQATNARAAPLKYKKIDSQDHMPRPSTPLQEQAKAVSLKYKEKHIP